VGDPGAGGGGAGAGGGGANLVWEIQVQLYRSVPVRTS
jgi:hypothetical protein